MNPDPMTVASAIRAALKQRDENIRDDQAVSRGSEDDETSCTVATQRPSSEEAPR